MTHVKPAHLLFTCATILLLASTLSCTGGDGHPKNDGAVWFVQVTDPHFFLDTSKDADAGKKLAREKQEKLDQSALSDLWKQIPSLSNGYQPLSFLVVTGDFGIEPCSIADIPLAPTSPNKPAAKDCLDKVNQEQVNKDKRKSQITLLAGLLGASPVRDVYLVPGNNDIPFETASDDGLAYFNQFIDDVQKKIDDSNKNVQLHDLSRCYLTNGAASTCYTDIPDTPYRMLSFPSYSFKNREPGYESNTPLQEKQFETFRSLLDASRTAGKRVLILTHIPLIDDPYTLAQDRYAGVTPPAAIEKDPKNARSAWSTWNVSKKLADEWEEAVASDSVAAVLAGHLHDSHKEIYQRPYLWSTTNDLKTGFSKLYMAPPLSVKNQDGSPVQARGFALVGLDSDRIKYRLYWYDSQTGDFAPDRLSEPKGRKRLEWGSLRNSFTASVIRCLKSFWEFACPKSLDYWAIFFIASLAAFLTVVQVWQIPPAENPLTGTAKSSDDKKDVGGAKTTESKPAFDPSPFASNFGKTVIFGLGGLATETVLKSLENKPVAQDKEFYIVWFILFFFLLLLLSAALRGVVEALRTRLAIIYYPAPRPPRPFGGVPGGGPNGDSNTKNALLRFWDWLVYWLYYRLFGWLLSLRFPLLTFFDTFVNLIQGKNQTLTRVFSDKIIEQQRNVVRVANVIRQQVNEVIFQHVLVEDKDKQIERDSRDVRVNISVMSADQSSLLYIARTPGSSIKVFPKRSVAWVSVFAGRIRWYKHIYFDDKDLFPKIVLFDNSAGVIPDAESKVMLSSSYQQRDDDYEAFVIFPVPWPQRAFGDDYVKGAIHISFRHQADFEKIWTFKFRAPESSKAQDPVEWNDPQKGHTYRSEESMLGDWCSDPKVKAVLREAIAVLGELLRGFNENIYKSSGGS